jgi:uncharacterized protein (TIGR00290 family)
MKEKVLVSWSGGKDSALALHELCKGADYEPEALLTTISSPSDRVSMHGVRRALIEQQARSLGLPIELASIPSDATDEQYQATILPVLLKYHEMGIRSVVFGDVFLEDVREYRQSRLSRLQMKGVFPLWQKDTRKLAQKFVNTGFQAVITCVDMDVLDGSFVGRSFDHRFLSELPANTDPCGENGEFHSFVYGGPIFGHRVSHQKGEVVVIDNRFRCCDLVPVPSGRAVPGGVGQQS